MIFFDYYVHPCIFVKKSSMEASQDYRDNMFGASYVSQYLKKKKKKDAKDQEVSMSCSKDGCAAYDTGGGGSGAGSKGYTVKTSSASTGEKNKVLTPKQVAKRKEEMEEFRRKEKEKHSPSTRSKF
jgi:hypothetical protein